MRRAASELRDAADEILETAASLDEGAERLNTLETIVRLKGRDMISRVERLEKQMAEVLKFVKKLCNGNYPSIAVYMFSNKTWTKGYLTRRTQAWNASGGASADTISFTRSS